jgi:hypothetical protein
MAPLLDIKYRWVGVCITLLCSLFALLAEDIGNPVVKIDFGLKVEC